MVIDPNEVTEDDSYTIVHFVGYWEKPTDADADHIKEELRNDPEFGMGDKVDELRFYPATPGCIEYYNKMGEADGIFEKETPIENQN